MTQILNFALLIYCKTALRKWGKSQLSLKSYFLGMAGTVDGWLPPLPGVSATWRVCKSPRGAQWLCPAKYDVISEARCCGEFRCCLIHDLANDAGALLFIAWFSLVFTFLAAVAAWAFYALVVKPRWLDRIEEPDVWDDVPAPGTLNWPQTLSGGLTAKN